MPPDESRTPKQGEHDEKVKIDLPFKDTLWALLKTPPEPPEKTQPSKQSRQK